MAAGVTIRPVKVADAPALTRLYQRNREFLAPFEPGRPASFFTVEGQRESLRDATARAEAGTLWRYLVLDETDDIAGVISLQNIIRGPAQTADVGYWIDGERNGRGIATNAVSALVAEAFGHHGLHRLEAGVRPDNLSSRRVLEKNGFETIGTARRYLYLGGAWRDHVLYQRLAD
jgi:ribosomal-protein-alanine N-acetyltransferase